jgi:hypothetical protein
MTMAYVSSSHTLWEEVRQIKRGLEEAKAIVDGGFSQSSKPRTSTRHGRHRVSQHRPEWARDLQTLLRNLSVKIACMEKTLQPFVSQEVKQNEGGGRHKEHRAPIGFVHDETVTEDRLDATTDEQQMSIDDSRNSPSSHGTVSSPLPSMNDAIWDANVTLTKSPIPPICLRSPSTEEAISAIKLLSSHEGDKAFISRGTNLAGLASVTLDDNVYFQNVVHPSDIKGSCHVTVDRGDASVKWPDTSQTVPRPTEAQVEEAFKDFISNPPGRAAYYGGCASTVEDNFLSPLGKTLPPDITQANTPYFHIGERFSGTPLHREDANFWSCNIVEFGWKLWIIIRDTTKLEQFVQKHWQTNDCENFLRHLNLMLCPSLLRREGIAFDIYCAGQGEMVITSPGTYHQVLNFSPCIALSVNFLLPNQAPFPGDFKVCEDCGLYPWNGKNGVKTVPRPSKVVVGSSSSQYSAFKSKRKAATFLESPLRKTRAQIEMEKTIDNLKAHYPGFIPAYDVLQPPPPRVLMLAVGIRSMMTDDHIEYLATSITQYKVISALSPSPAEDRLSLCCRVLNDAVQRSEFSNTRLRIAELELVLEVNARKPGYLKNTPTDLRAELMRRFSWTDRQLSNHLERGKAWARLCGENKTLLCFIPHRGNRLDLDLGQYKSLNDTDLSHFHNLLSDERARDVFASVRNLQEAILCLGDPR